MPNTGYGITGNFDNDEDPVAVETVIEETVLELPEPNFDMHLSQASMAKITMRYQAYDDRVAEVRSCEVFLVNVLCTDRENDEADKAYYRDRE